LGRRSFHLLINIGIGFFSLVNLRNDMVKQRNSTIEALNKEIKEELPVLKMSRIVSQDPAETQLELPEMKSYSQLRSGGVNAEFDYRYMEVFAKKVLQDIFQIFRHKNIGR